MSTEHLEWDAPPVGVVPILISDRARRAHGEIMGHYYAIGWDGVKNSWVAIRLSDGGSDHVLYDTKRDAVRHQLHEQQCAYIAYRGLGPSGSNPGELERYLDFQQKAYEAGFRLADPDDKHGGPDIAPTAGRMDHFRNNVHPSIQAQRAVEWLKEQRRGGRI